MCYIYSANRQQPPQQQQQKQQQINKKNELPTENSIFGRNYILIHRKKDKLLTHRQPTNWIHSYNNTEQANLNIAH